MPGSAEGRSLRRRDFFCLQLFGVFMFAVGLVAGLLIGIYAYHGAASTSHCPSVAVTCSHNAAANYAGEQTATKDGLDKQETPDEDCLVCKKRDPFQTVEKPDEQLFAPLSVDEMTLIRRQMVEQGLVTDKVETQVSLTDNLIFAMDPFIPSKTATLAYLDNGGSFPGRYAKVLVIRGAASPPDNMEYVIGPLRNGSMTITQLYDDGELVYESKPINYIETLAYDNLLVPAFQILRKLTIESFDGAFYPNGGLDLFAYNGSPGRRKGEREVRITAYFNPWARAFDYHLIDFLPLSCTIQCQGTNVSSWRIYKFYYLNKGPFDTAEDLLAAYDNGDIRKFKHETGYRNTVPSRTFPSRDTTLPYRENAQMPPPRTYEPEGPRYQIQGHRVSWMDWSFHVTTSMMRGPALFDVQFKGERIVYELALNEIALLYGGDSAANNNAMFTDATYSIGSTYNGVVPAVDCPEHSSLLEATHYSYPTGKPASHKAICVFEADGEEASWRHKPNTYSTGLRNTFLVVRATSVIGNYEYTIEFKFMLDGKLYTKAKATGLLQATFWDPENPHRGTDNSRDAFGFRVSDYTHGMMHDHTFGFKVDLDIIDRNNSFEMIHFKAGDVVTALNSQKPGVTEAPPYFIYNETRYLEYETLQQEAAFLINPLKPVFWTVVNEKYKNKWGAKRGYLISPLATSAQTMVDSHPALQALSFTKHHCAVTKHSDREQYLDHLLDGYRLNDPIGDLEKQLNGENVVNEDLVNWVTVGFLHIPTSEDVPMTVSVETGFMLKPFNFFDRTAVYDMPQYTEAVFDPNVIDRPPESQPCVEEQPETL